MQKGFCSDQKLKIIRTITSWWLAEKGNMGMNETAWMKKMGVAAASGKGATWGEESAVQKGKSHCRRNTENKAFS